MLLGIIAKPLRRDKFEVTPDSVAYLTALVAVSEEVRSRCHVKHALPRWPAASENGENATGSNGIQNVSVFNFNSYRNCNFFYNFLATWHVVVKKTKILGYFRSIGSTICQTSQGSTSGKLKINYLRTICYKCLSLIFEIGIEIHVIGKVTVPLNFKK